MMQRAYQKAGSDMPFEFTADIPHILLVIPRAKDRSQEKKIQHHMVVSYGLINEIKLYALFSTMS